MVDCWSLGFWIFGYLFFGWFVCLTVFVGFDNFSVELWFGFVILDSVILGGLWDLPCLCWVFLVLVFYWFGWFLCCWCLVVVFSFGFGRCFAVFACGVVKCCVLRTMFRVCFFDWIAFGGLGDLVLFYFDAWLWLRNLGIWFEVVFVWV